MNYVENIYKIGCRFDECDASEELGQLHTVKAMALIASQAHRFIGKRLSVEVLLMKQRERGRGRGRGWVVSRYVAFIGRDSVAGVASTTLANTRQWELP